MTDEKYSWINTHSKITEFLRTKEHSQRDLIKLLKSVGVGPFNDKTGSGEHDIELDEIDPFTFFFYIYKYGPKKRLEILQQIAEKLDIEIPSDDSGIPSSQAQRVWLFPYKYARNNNEVGRLWEFFKKELNDQITDKDFADVLQIQNTGKTKLTEALFYINPVKYLPIDGPTKPYIKEVFGIDPKFDTYSEYKEILAKIKLKTTLPFYEISYEAWKWTAEKQDPSKSKKVKRYWLYAPGENAGSWNEFYSEGIMGLGWGEIGDLTQYKSKAEIKKALDTAYGGTGSKMNDALANYDFLYKVSVGDVVIAKKGRRVLLGYGIVTEDYIFDENRSEYPHIRKVDWKLKGKWEVDFNLALKTLTDITAYSSDHGDYDTYYERLMGIMIKEPRETQDQMNFPLNTIFYGPPGTGKTYNSLLRAAEIIENRKIDSYEDALDIFMANLHDQIEFITFHQNYSYEDFIQGLRPDTENDKELTFERKNGVFKVIADKALKNISAVSQPTTAKKTFEDTFNEFVSPLVKGEIEEIEVRMKKVTFFITAVTNKSIEFRKNSGGTQHTMSIATLRKMYDAGSILDMQGLSSYYSPLLEELLKKGMDSKGRKEIVQRKNYVIIIDEINRANISRVFGELITLIEPDKRSHGEIPLEARLPSGDLFVVPSNLFIIGTMNTADKSIALLDIALRRRFDFESMYPQYAIKDQEIYDVDVLKKINNLIIESKGRDFQIGHAYFMGENKDLIDRMNKKVIPLLLEYYMNDEKEVESILQSAGLIIEDNSWPIKIIGRND